MERGTCGRSMPERSSRQRLPVLMTALSMWSGGALLPAEWGLGCTCWGVSMRSGDGCESRRRLYDGAGTGGAAQTHASVEGDSTQLFELVDRLSAQLLVKRGPGTRLAETAAVTTRSLVALKAYLDGERRLRAASLQRARLDSAITMFQRAVTEDSTFALAQYRMAVAAGWANRPAMATAAANRALSMSGRLTQRDRRLLTAYVDFRRELPTAPSGSIARSSVITPTISKPGFSSPTSSITTIRFGAGTAPKHASCSIRFSIWIQVSSDPYDPCGTSPCARKTMRRQTP